MLDHTLSLLYRVGRRAAREGRRRMPGLYRAWDLARLRSTLRGQDPRDLLLDSAALAPWASGGGSHPPVETWADDREARAIVARADAACGHVFDLLGSGPVDLGDPIDWHRDFKSGHRWPAGVHHLAIRWDAVPDGVDIKVPWELSRCQHFATFGLADWISGDERYYHEFKTQVGQWIAANPCGFGVNWLCAMDVAIRAVNWLTAAMLFRHRIEADDDRPFFAQLVESLWLHGRHIMRNLEWQGPRSTNLSNHFLADLAGLLAVGALFRHFPQGRRWLDFACRWFETEILLQVLDDGTAYETSTSYHRLDMEMFQWAETMGQRVGMPFSELYRDRFARMAAFVRAYTSPSGAAAQFGDNDSGRLLTAGIDDGRNHLYLTDSPCGFGGRANRLLLRGSVRSHDTPVVVHLPGRQENRSAAEMAAGNRPSSTTPAPSNDLAETIRGSVRSHDTLVVEHLPGRQENRSAAEMAAGNRPSLIESFPQGGYWFMRCADAWVGIRAGVVSHHGAHAHCDQLSFVLAVGEDDFIIDPGTGTYSADVGKRNAYRGSAAHNAPRLNDLEANRFPPGKAGLFRMTDDTRTEVLTWEVAPEAVRFTGRHHGYGRVRAGCLCERSLILGPATLTVTDRISPLLPGDRISWSFRLAPEVALEPAPGGAIATINDQQVRITTEPVLECEVVEAPFSPGYGVEVPSRALHLARAAGAPPREDQRIVLSWRKTPES